MCESRLKVLPSRLSEESPKCAPRYLIASVSKHFVEIIRNLSSNSLEADVAIGDVDFVLNTETFWGLRYAELHEN